MIRNFKTISKAIFVSLVIALLTLGQAYATEKKSKDKTSPSRLQFAKLDIAYLFCDNRGLIKDQIRTDSENKANRILLKFERDRLKKIDSLLRDSCRLIDKAEDKGRFAIAAEYAEDVKGMTEAKDIILQDADAASEFEYLYYVLYEEMSKIKANPENDFRASLEETLLKHASGNFPAAILAQNRMVAAIKALAYGVMRGNEAYDLKDALGKIIDSVFDEIQHFDSDDGISLPQSKFESLMKELVDTEAKKYDAEQDAIAELLVDIEAAVIRALEDTENGGSLADRNVGFFQLKAAIDALAALNITMRNDSAADRVRDIFAMVPDNLAREIEFIFETQESKALKALGLKFGKAAELDAIIDRIRDGLESALLTIENNGSFLERIGAFLALAGAINDLEENNNGAVNEEAAAKIADIFSIVPDGLLRQFELVFQTQELRALNAVGGPL